MEFAKVDRSGVHVRAAVMVAALAGVVGAGVGVVIDDAWLFTPGAAVAVFGCAALLYLKLTTRS